MKNKIVSLLDMVKLSDNEALSENYVRYICGVETERQYKHQEILDIKCLLDNLSLPVEKAAGFLFGYVVPQLNKEFDLLKITESVCLNIELKSGEVSVEKIKLQLRQNIHYLKLLNKQTLLSFLRPETFSRLLREELNPEQKEKVMRAIYEISYPIGHGH